MERELAEAVRKLTAQVCAMQSRLTVTTVAMQALIAASPSKSALRPVIAALEAPDAIPAGAESADAYRQAVADLRKAMSIGPQ
jgi:hypothetical protein